MASFKAVLQVAGNQYEIRYSEFNLWQFTDELGRPASPTLGGGFVLDIEEPPKGDSLLFEWAISPVMQLNGQVVFWDMEGKMLKVIKFHHAFLVNLRGAFDGSGQGPGGPSKQTQLTISPQAVDNNGQLHDNNWPAPDPIIDWDWSEMNQQCNPDAIKPKPSALSEGLHTLLDVVGMIPIVGEIADGANAAIYAAEGDYANAALSAAAMIPIAGNLATGAKLAKRGAKLLGNAKALKVIKGKGKLWKVGTYEKLRGLVPGLDAHHVGQKALMSEFVPGYDLLKAPTILVPKIGHTIKGVNGIVSRSAKNLNSARQVIARDIRELRRVYPDIPNKALKELIDLNKKMYPKELKKITRIKK